MLFITASGFETLHERLENLSQKAQDLTPVLREIGDAELNRIALRFEYGKAPDGSAWKPLKSRQGQILVDTARLKNSFSKNIINSQTLLVGTNVAYAPHHQYGTKSIPARKFLGSSDDLLRSIEDLLGDYLIGN